MSEKDKALKKIFDYNTAEIINDQNKNFYNFWRKSYSHFNIVLLLSSTASGEIGNSYEDICKLYPSKFASRTTISTILHEGIEKNFFIMTINKEDHRKHNYKLSSEHKKIVVDWLINHPVLSL